MRLLFIQPEFENIGIEYVSAALKREGHATDLVFIPKPFENTSFKVRDDDEGEENSKISKKIESFKPDVIGFSPFTSHFRWSVRKSEFIKQKFPEKFILFGGVHASFIPETTIEEESIDGVMVGEAEIAIVEFAKNFGDRAKLLKTPNLWIADKGEIRQNDLAPQIEMDDLPYPDKDLFYDIFPEYQKRSTFTFMASRGCPYQCTYCCNDIYFDLYKGQQTVRFQSPKYVVEQLKYFKNKFHFNRVDFMDDVLATKLERLEEMLPLYKKEIGLPWVCFMYPNRFTIKESVVKILKETGCEWMKVGVQSADEDYRRNILKRRETNDLVIKLADVCKKHKLSFSFDHILNMPGETTEGLIAAIRLYNRCKPVIVNFGSLIYLPKTRIVEHGLKYREITEEDVKLINKGLDPMVGKSNIERFKGKESAINYSIITFLLIVVTLLPRGIFERLLKTGFYNSKFQIPSAVLVLLKVASKFKARQGYIYLSAVKYSLYYGLIGKIRRIFGKDVLDQTKKLNDGILNDAIFSAGGLGTLASDDSFTGNSSWTFDQKPVSEEKELVAPEH